MKTLTRTLAICTLLVCSIGICNAQNGYMVIGKTLCEIAKVINKPAKPVYQPTIHITPNVRNPIIKQSEQRLFIKPAVAKTSSLIEMNSKGSGKSVTPDDIIKNITQRYHAACIKYNKDSIADFELIEIGQYAAMAGFSYKAKDCFTKYATKCSNVPSVIRTDIEKYFRLTASLPTMQYNKPFFNYMPAIMDNLFLFVGNSVCTDIVEGDYRKGLPMDNGSGKEIGKLTELTVWFAKENAGYCNALKAIYSAKEIDGCYKALEQATMMAATAKFKNPATNERSTELMARAILAYASRHDRVSQVLDLFEEPALAQHAKQNINTALYLYDAALESGDSRAEKYYRYGTGIDAEKFRIKVQLMKMGNTGK